MSIAGVYVVHTVRRLYAFICVLSSVFKIVCTTVCGLISVPLGNGLKWIPYDVSITSFCPWT